MRSYKGTGAQRIESFAAYGALAGCIHSRQSIDSLMPLYRQLDLEMAEIDPNGTRSDLLVGRRLTFVQGLEEFIKYYPQSGVGKGS
jgi:hypothetical protein